MVKLFFIVSLCILYLTSQEKYNINKQEEIESVFQSIKAGDEIIFHEGTYQLSIGLDNLKGTEEKPTILKSAEGEIIIFYDEHGKILAISGCNYVYIKGPFTFINHQIYITNSANYININNIKISINNQNPINIGGNCLNIQISNSEIFISKEIIIEGSNNINISNNKIYNNDGKDFSCLNIETMNFNNNIIYGNSDNNIYLYEFNSVIFDGNYLINNFPNDNVYLENNSYQTKSVFLKNNIIIGGNNCLAIELFDDEPYSYYNDFKILNNIIIFPKQNAVMP